MKKYPYDGGSGALRRYARRVRRGVDSVPADEYPLKSKSPQKGAFTLGQPLHKCEGYAQDRRRQAVQFHVDLADQFSSFHFWSPSGSAFRRIKAPPIVRSYKTARRENFPLRARTICRKL